MGTMQPLTTDDLDQIRNATGEMPVPVKPLFRCLQCRRNNFTASEMAKFTIGDKGLCRECHFSNEHPTRQDRRQAVRATKRSQGNTNRTPAKKKRRK